MLRGKYIKAMAMAQQITGAAPAQPLVGAGLQNNTRMGIYSFADSMRGATLRRKASTIRREQR